MSEELQEMLNTPTLNPGDLVKGTVVEVDDKKVIVDIGYKFQGIIPIRELSPLRIQHPSEVVAVGDEVLTSVVKLDEDSEAVILSRRDAAAQTAWEDLVQKYESRTPFEVTVHDVVKGGLVTDVGVRGFIPASLVDLKFVDDLESFKGKKIRVMVVEIDPENNKLILSRKAVLEQEQAEEAARTIASLEVGSVVEGTVQRLTNFGVFVDVGGVDGLVHVSELAWHHVADPSEVVKPGDKVKVKILRADPEAGRVSLSMKEASPSPWETAAYDFHPGDVVTGVVRRVVDFGAFVELKPGLEGLVHVSQISYEHVAKASDVLEEGQEVKVKVLAVDPERQRISLSIKDAESRGGGRREPRHTSYEDRSSGSTGATIGDLFRDLFNKG
ncbi:30S ribosomal protein S1 [Alicyclobacillus macrosporangiidus]|jgi:small subunit ribosomal protein S1|uniref:Small subunit ribosomal protein S1 n=1 Tax=Alicyclobacillus macrosporangiidus TaxID=392015 RepID=A0A1I7L770_9BACL|nr:30S ribosomal protein S1 [Alicyclobacillus macrosporangiidus]SFV05579.1 small subunit ribosomal protein S1 [Alicyclobacillus macrosporangiidus]